VYSHTQASVATLYYIVLRLNFFQIKGFFILLSQNFKIFRLIDQIDYQLDILRNLTQTKIILSGKTMGLDVTSEDDEFKEDNKALNDQGEGEISNFQVHSL
jgi:hypothetical protein